MKVAKLILLLGKRNFLVRLSEKKLHTEFGIIDLTKLSKKKFGDKIKSHTGEEFIVARPTLTDIFKKKAKRLAQIVMPEDAALILSITGVAPDSLIVDAGSGSGFLSIFLAYYCSKGKVVTYEKNRNFVGLVKENIYLTGLKNIQVKQKDVLKGIEEKNIDLITLDMKNAEKLIGKAYKALKFGGWLVIYSTHIEQIQKVVKAIKRNKFTHVKTIESIRREWQVEYHTRPHTSGVMHTGWLTFARKIN